MKKVSLLVISSLFLLTGCTLFGGGEDTSTVPSIPAENPTPIPETPGNNINNSISSTSGLIPSTNPQNRLQQINQGRNDPFDSITPPAVIRVKSDRVVPESVASKKAILKEDPVTAVGNADVGDNKNNVVSNGVSGGNNLSPFQPPATPSLRDAENIIVSGILSLNGENVALIQTPWDKVTRSVRIGDIVSDNTSGISVRVKDINFGDPTTIALQEDNQTVLRSINDNNAVVILEQSGQRVIRQIGDNDDDNLATL